MVRLRGSWCGCALACATLLASCSPYYSFLPKSLTYEMSYGTKGETPPDTVVIAHSDLAQIFPAGANPRNVSVAPPRKVPHGWGFCLRATVDWSNGPPRKVTMWVTVVSAGIYDRKPAEPADQCELEEFIVVTPA